MKILAEDLCLLAVSTLGLRLIIQYPASNQCFVPLFTWNHLSNEPLNPQLGKPGHRYLGQFHEKDMPTIFFKVVMLS